MQTLAHDFLDIEEDEGFDVPSSAHDTLDEVITIASGNIAEFMDLSASGLVIGPGAIAHSIDSLLKDKGFSYKENGLLSHALETRKMDCKGYTVLTHSVMEKAWQNAVSSLGLGTRLGRKLMPHKYQQFPVSIALEPRHIFLILDVDTRLLDWETTPGNNGIVHLGERKRHCLRKIQKDEVKAVAYSACAAEWSNRGCFNAALKLRERAIHAFPNNGKYYANLADDQRLFGASREKVDKIIEEGMEIDKRDPSLYAVRSSLHLHDDNIDAALKDINTAISLCPAIDTYYVRRAYLHKRKGNYEDGIFDCKFALLIDPEYADAYIEMAALHMAADEIEEAVNDFSGYIKLRPDEPRGYGLRGAVLELLGRNDEASKDFAMETKLSTPPPTEIVDPAEVREVIRKRMEAAD